MSVHKAKGTIPEGAVRLTEQEAINRQWQLIMNWTPEKDVITLRPSVFHYGTKHQTNINSKKEALYIITQSVAPCTVHLFHFRIGFADHPPDRNSCSHRRTIPPCKELVECRGTAMNETVIHI
ncbi:Putative conserved plasma membrane protein [Gryllus bimaculatus]|nr:Putative conserved plasma membrane protein [Gryllus bimaculatus]